VERATSVGARRGGCPLARPSAAPIDRSAARPRRPPSRAPGSARRSSTARRLRPRHLFNPAREKGFHRSERWRRTPRPSTV